MADIASLGIKVTTQGAKEAAADLDKLKVSGDKAATATQTTSKAFSGTAKTAKELQFATRGLPAQFTDIATSLASGQKPMLVFLQQGGQIKDIFGGVGPALRAMGGYVAGLINPLTLAAAAVAVAGLAFKQAQDEASAFNQAIILTGDYAGVSADRLADMAQKLDRTTGATAGKASEVLAQVAATGKFTADQIALVTEAAIRMEDATGKAIQDTIKEFVQLQNDPVDAILKLNDSQHFLTETTLEQIKSLQEQGREADAAAVAIKAYADTINTRAPEVVANLTAWSGLFRDLKMGAKEAFDEIVQGFRDSDESAKRAFRSATTFASTFGPMAASIAGLAQGAFAFESNKAQAAKFNATKPVRDPMFANVVNGDQAVNSRDERARIDAEKEFSRLAESNLSKRARLEAEITKIRDLGAKAGKTQLEIDQQIAEARARYEESLPKGRKPRKTSDSSIQNASDRFDDMVGQFKSELEGPLQKVEQDHLRRLRELDQAATKGKRSHDDLAAAVKLEGDAYKKAGDEIRNRYASEAASLSGPIAAAQQSHADQLRYIDQLTKDASLSAEQHAKMLGEEAKAYEKDMRAAERAADPIKALLVDMQAEVDLIGKSNAERAIANELTREGIDLSGGYAQAKLAEARAIQQQGEAQQRSIDLMDEFRQGASNALSDFVTGAKSAKDALKDFFDEMAAQITKAIANQWMDKLFGKQGSSQTGSAGDSIFSILSMFGGGSANGNAFVNGSTVQAFANGGVVNSPTFFGMSGGRFGVMGENNKPEAILPLHRGPDGKLGVRMAANDDAPMRGDTYIQTSFVLPQTMTPQTQAQIAQNQQRAATRATSRNR